MKFRGTKAALAALLGGALLLGACTSGEDPGTTTTNETSTPSLGGSDPAEVCVRDAGITETADGQVIYSPGPGQWSGYNNLTSGTYSTYNSVVSDQMFGNFWYFGTDGTICEDKTFGTFEKVNDDPLEVKYTIAENAKWSDGTPITINDYLMGWAVQNPEFLVPGLASGANPDAVAVFNHTSSTFAEKVPDGPQGTVNSKEFTLKYETAYPDYKIIVDPPQPSHVVAKQAGLEPEAFAQAILDKDAATVAKAADFWNTGWIFEPGQLPAEELIPSSGPYKVKQGGWQDTTLTLEANDKYWGPPAATRNLVFSYVDDAQMAQSLQNGDLNVIDPQPTVDTRAQLEALGSGVTVETYSKLTWEHLDFNFRDSNVFSDAQGGKALREAFAYCVPRETIVNNLIKPIYNDTVVMNAREVFPFQTGEYEAVTSASYDGRYDQVNLEKAKELVAQSGIPTPIDVRLGYKAGNQRRQETVAAIAASCKDAGFNIIDSASADFFSKEIVNGDYEVALFAWASSGQIASGQNIQSTGKPQNYGQYSSAVVDEAWGKLSSTLDRNEQVEQIKIIEKQLWDDLFNIPLYAHPGLSAWDNTVSNVRTTATQSQVSWNASQWKVN
ncbi:MAG: ABC transporter substrate-binding protein [Propionibacteriaceae bacterium]|nr:ABC transporter substrate-binding protein [Propionibacteriaceae bacterium]